MVQTLLNFHSGRSDATNSNGRKAPALSEAKTNDNMLTDEADRADSQQKSQEMEDIEPTQSTALSWPSTTTSSQDSQQNRVRSTSLFEKPDLGKQLAQTALETTRVLPSLLDLTPHAPPKGYLYSPPNPPHLHRKYCPKFPPTAIRVHDADTLDTAIGLAQCAKYVTVHDKKPVCVLNMANAYSAGGGWKKGALAQEEALCYRSSLSFTLKLRYYPIPEFGAIYSPTVIVIRKSLKENHRFYPLDKPEEFPVVSVISVAAICRPEVVTERVPGPQEVYRTRYAKREDRETMKEKMRVILRTAACNGHRRLVLGALGCGAFLNPREEVADCWAEVFSESEFTDGWWESVIFAVMDDLGEGVDGDGNFGVFYRRLNGLMV